jgi:hypothetical protein
MPKKTELLDDWKQEHHFDEAGTFEDVYLPG